MNTLELAIVAKFIKQLAAKDAEIKRLKAAAKPKYIFDPKNWENTYEMQDIAELEDNLGMNPSEVHECYTLIQGPSKWAALVAITKDEYGDPDETELQWFDTKDEAKEVVR